MKNKKTININIMAIVIICIILIFAIVKFVNKNSKNTSEGGNQEIEDYVREHYLNFELLDYITGNVTNESKMAYAIDQINKTLGKKQNEIKQDELKSKYSEIFAEDLEITEAAFMLPNGYEFEQSRGTFVNKMEDENNELEDQNSKNQNVLEITGSKYDKANEKYIVMIEEKSGKGENAILIKTTDMELKSNGNGGYIIIDYYKENK